MVYSLQQWDSIKDVCKQHNPNKTFTKVLPNTGSLHAAKCYRTCAGGGRWENPKEEEDEEAEVEEQEMSWDVGGIDWTSACPSPFINKDNLPHACGQWGSVTMIDGGAYLGNTCGKTNQSENGSQSKAKKKRGFTLNRYWQNPNEAICHICIWKAFRQCCGNVSREMWFMRRMYGTD